MNKTKHAIRLSILMLVGLTSLAGTPVKGDDLWITFEGKDNRNNTKHIVFVTGDEEYRSEESMPQLAKILATHHGFKCTVLFAINKETGEIDPQTVDNIPGLQVLQNADLMVLFLRFRELPDQQMKYIIDYTNSGKPIIGLRTSTHPFYYKKHPDSPYAKYSFQNQQFKGGYGRQVLGETWINHYGAHQKESTRGLIAKGRENHPLVKSCEDIWGPSDVYGITTLSGDCQPLIIGQVLQGMDPKDQPNPDKPPLPVAWTKTYTGQRGKTARVFTTTMGHGGDFKSAGFRRLLVNACYWCLKQEDQIPPKSKVDLVGEYHPSPIGFAKHKKGVLPSDHKVRLAAGAITGRPEPLKPYKESITTKGGQKISFQMAFIQAGTFDMGSPPNEPGRKEHEGPQHKVRLDPFYLCTTETTFELFLAYYQETVVDKIIKLTLQPEKQKPQKAGTSAVNAITGPTPVYGDLTMGYSKKHPAIGMTWHNATTFCRWLSQKTGKKYRLPTEAEWEYACRAGTTGVFGPGDDPNQLENFAWYKVNSNYWPHPVGRKIPNACGLYDMLGNVCEWINDFYSPNAYSQDPNNSPAVNPRGPKTGKVHVARGGDCYSSIVDLRCAARTFEDNSWRSGDPQFPKSKWWLPQMDFIGFRIARSAPPRHPRIDNLSP